MNLLHVYTYTHIYTCVHMYICIEVLSSVFNYRMWLPNSVVPGGWHESSEMNIFFLKRVCMYLYWNGFPALSTHAACYPRKSPKLNVNIQHLSVWVYLLAFGCCDWPLKIVPLSTNALVLALIIFKRKWAIEFFIWFILKLVLLVFARTKQ